MSHLWSLFQPFAPGSICILIFSNILPCFFFKFLFLHCCHIGRRFISGSQDSQAHKRLHSILIWKHWPFVTLSFLFYVTYYCWFQYMPVSKFIALICCLPKANIRQRGIDQKYFYHDTKSHCVETYFYCPDTSLTLNYTRWQRVAASPFFLSYSCSLPVFFPFPS